MKRLVRALLPSLIIATLSASSIQAARNPNPGVMPPQSKPLGMSMGDWGLAWWAWALGTDIDHSPLFDLTGENAWVNQTQGVFFLAGTFGGTADRTVTIPPGTPLFWPVNNWFWAYPYDRPDMTPIEAEASLRAFLDDFYAEFPEENLGVTVDGVPLTGLKTYRAQSDAKPFYIAPDSVGSVLGGYPPGWQDFAVVDGYWIMLAPLPPGQHLITSRSGPADNPDIFVTYHITVLPPGKAK